MDFLQSKPVKPILAAVLTITIIFGTVTIFMRNATGEVSKTDVLVAAATILYTVLTAGLFLSAHLSNRHTTHGAEPTANLSGSVKYR